MQNPLPADRLPRRDETAVQFFRRTRIRADIVSMIVFLAEAHGWSVLGLEEAKTTTSKYLRLGRLEDRITVRFADHAPSWSRRRGSSFPSDGLYDQTGLRINGLLYRRIASVPRCGVTDMCRVMRRAEK